MGTAFRYDGSGIHEAYVTARALTDDARRVVSRAIADHLGRSAVARVLDLGCGTGRFSALLGELLSASVLAVDPSADMLGQAPRDAGPRLVRAAAEALPFAAGSMDAVFTAMAYHHFADRHAALAECARVLRAGGRLMIYTPTRETLASYLWMRFFPTAVAVDTARMPGRDALVESARRLPFELEDHSTLRRPFTRDLREYAERIGMRAISTLRLVPDEEFEAGLAALRRHCAEHDRGEAVYEDFDVFLFRRRAPRLHDRDSRGTLSG